MTYAVQQRTQEIGIRMALGAETSGVLKLVLRQGMTFSLIGVVMGTTVAFMLAKVLQAFLYGVQPRDPLVFIAVPLLLTLIALVAVVIPALRAARIDPLLALRYE